jgi:hypothetical protein
MATEQERAEAFRRSRLARERNDKAMEQRLRGDQAARLQLRDSWDPLALALQEARDRPGDEC